MALIVVAVKLPLSVVEDNTPVLGLNVYELFVNGAVLAVTPPTLPING